jgi:hypothetical protein
VHVYTRARLCMYMDIHICVYICINMYVYMYVFMLTYTLIICIEDIFAKLQNELQDLMSNTKDKVDHAKPQLEVSPICTCK